MRHKWKVSVLSIGAVASLLLGSGMFSLTQDTVTSQGNSAESGTFAAAHDIQAAKVAPNGCATATTYSNGPIAAAISTPVGAPNITFPTSSTDQQDDFCIKNFGTESTKVTVAFLALVQSEVGACQASEASGAQGADATCTAGGQGELASILTAEFGISGGSSSDSCSGSNDNGTPFLDYNAGLQLIDVDLEPGDVCSVFLGLDINAGATTNQMLAAQTDRITWSIVFFADDAV